MMINRYYKLSILFFISFALFSFSGCETTPVRQEPPSNAPVAYFPKMVFGDTWTTREYHQDAKGFREIFHRKVVEVGQDGSFVIELTGEKTGKHQYVYYNNKYQATKKKALTTPMLLNFPLYTGKRWKCQYWGYSVDGHKYDYEYKCSVVKYERVTTEAGSFDAFKIIAYGENLSLHSCGWRDKYWYAPEVKLIVLMKTDRIGERRALLSYKMATTDERTPVVKKSEPKTEPQIKKTISESAKPIEKPKIIIKGKKAKVGILEFQTLNKEAKEENLGAIISETLTTSLVNSEAFKIIEREQLQKLIKKLKPSQAAIIDTSSAKQIGKITGADAIIIGGVTKIGNYLRLDARIIDVETGIIITAEKSECKFDIKDIGRMADQIVVNLVNKFYKEKE